MSVIEFGPGGEEKKRFGDAYDVAFKKSDMQINISIDAVKKELDKRGGYLPLSDTVHLESVVLLQTLIVDINQLIELQKVLITKVEELSSKVSHMEIQ